MIDVGIFSAVLFAAICIGLAISWAMIWANKQREKDDEGMSRGYAFRKVGK